VQHASRLLSSAVTLDAVDDLVFNSDYAALTNAVWQEATLAKRRELERAGNLKCPTNKRARTGMGLGYSAKTDKAIDDQRMIILIIRRLFLDFTYLLTIKYTLN
jgi:hypothetical protein